MKKLLITGFAPFGGETVNPSWEAVRRLPDEVGDYALTRCLLPVEYGRAAEEAVRKAEEVRPDVILCVGQAGGRAAVTPEMLGINLRYASIPDNAGSAPKDTPVVPGGEDALFSTVPVRAMAEAIRAAGYPGQVSLSAGAYVCNDLLYSLLHRFSGTDTRCGFIHLPYLPEQAGEKYPSLPLEDMTSALRAAILALDGEE